MATYHYIAAAVAILIAVAAFAWWRERASEQAMAELAQQSQELGMGYGRGVSDEQISRT